MQPGTPCRWLAASESHVHRVRDASGKMAGWSLLAPALTRFHSPGPAASYFQRAQVYPHIIQGMLQTRFHGARGTSVTKASHSGKNNQAGAVCSAGSAAACARQPDLPRHIPGNTLVGYCPPGHLFVAGKPAGRPPSSRHIYFLPGLDLK